MSAEEILTILKQDVVALAKESKAGVFDIDSMRLMEERARVLVCEYRLTPSHDAFLDLYVSCVELRACAETFDGTRHSMRWGS